LCWIRPCFGMRHPGCAHGSRQYPGVPNGVRPSEWSTWEDQAPLAAGVGTQRKGRVQHVGEYQGIGNRRQAMPQRRQRPDEPCYEMSTAAVCLCVCIPLSECHSQIATRL
jgi:hypothetical protein